MYLKIKQVFTLITISVSHTDCKHNSQPGKNCVHGLQIKLIMVVGFFLLFLFSFVIFFFFLMGDYKKEEQGLRNRRKLGIYATISLVPRNHHQPRQGAQNFARKKKKKEE